MTVPSAQPHKQARVSYFTQTVCTRCHARASTLGSVGCQFPCILLLQLQGPARHPGYVFQFMCIQVTMCNQVTMHEHLLGKHQTDGVSSLQLHIEMLGCNTLSRCKHRMQRQNACEAATVQKDH